MQTRGAGTGAANRAAKTATDAVEASLNAVIASLDDSKAEGVITIDIHGKSALGDYMVIASGRSHRHVGAIADHLLRDLKDKGFDAPRVEGLPNCDWVPRSARVLRDREDVAGAGAAGSPLIS
jgi:ribosome-associated protein